MTVKFDNATAAYTIAVSGLLLCFWGYPLDAGASENAAGSYEFKLLLLNDWFVERDTAIKELLERLKQNAEQRGAIVKWKKPEKRKTKQRQVRFLDTSDKREDAQILNQGVVFRTRIQMEEPCDSAQPDACKPAKYKVTLKRHFPPGMDGALFNMDPNLDEAKAFQAQVAEHDPKFEEDYGWVPSEDGSGTREVAIRRSSSSSVEIKNLEGRDQVLDYATIGDIMAVYDKVPWDEKKLQADAAIAPTCLIESTVVKVGKLSWKLNSGEEVECKASFTFWRKESGDRTPLASEFSYVCDDNGGAFAQVRDAVAAVFAQLINDKFANPMPDRKTRIAYRCAAD